MVSKQVAKPQRHFRRSSSCEGLTGGLHVLSTQPKIPWLRKTPNYFRYPDNDALPPYSVIYGVPHRNAKGQLDFSVKSIYTARNAEGRCAVVQDERLFPPKNVKVTCHGTITPDVCVKCLGEGIENQAVPAQLTI